MSAPHISRGADVALQQAAVRRVIGGRAYRGEIALAVRVHVMRARVRGQDRAAVASAAIRASAVASYLAEIGDREGAVRWHEMAVDLSLAWADAGPVRWGPPRGPVAPCRRFT